MPRPPLATLACLALALGGAFVAGCGGDDENDSTPAAQAPPPAADTSTAAEDTGGTKATTPAAVAMQSSKFVPEEISVSVGQQITWTNKDGYAHNVTSTSGEKIDSGNIDGGATFDFTPEQAGTIAYTCTLHANQNGTITVAK